MTNPPLHASHENVKRAKRKFSDLKLVINRYLMARPYSVRIEVKAGVTYVIARRERDLPEDIPWDVVETTLRLRVALDKAIVELVERNGRGTSGVGYPFGGIDGNSGQPNPFPDRRMTGKGGIKEKLTPDQWRLIEAQKPYPGGNDTLWAINEIANADKHRKGLVEVRPWLDQGGSWRNVTDALGGARRICIQPSQHDFPLTDDERETVMLSVEGAYNFRVDQQLFPSVVFGRIRPVEYGNVLVELNQQIRLVESMLEGFKRFLR